ncbi:hypothetical protein JB92DRAFT_2960799 [Gautieria morchelliformis]|nr:hypothetical protein JB92DRAFT_2960799 [Gautieria morchelliformis]
MTPTSATCSTPLNKDTGSPLQAAPSAATSPRIKATAAKRKLVFDSFNLIAVDLSHAGKDGRDGSLDDAMKNIMERFKVKVEASTQGNTGQTMFFIKGKFERKVEKAKHQLIALLSPVVALIIKVPASIIAAIEGPEGANLKHIRDQADVRINILRRDSLVPNGTNNNLNEASKPVARSGTTLPPSTIDGDEEATVLITIQGPALLAEEARSHLLAIVASKDSKVTQHVRDIPQHLASVLARKPQFEAVSQGDEIRLTFVSITTSRWTYVRDIPQHLVPFVLARKPQFEAVAQGVEIGLSCVEGVRLVFTGDREAVGRVVERVKATVEELRTGLHSITIQLPKRQHTLLVGDGNQEIFHEVRCSVVVPKPEEPGEDVRIWGLPADLSSGLQAVMERAHSQHIHEYPLPGPIALSRQMLTYINKTSFTKSLTNEHPDVAVYSPSFVPMDKQGSVNIDLVGEKAAVNAAVEKLTGLIGKLIGGTRDVEIDWLLHRAIQRKSAKKIKQFHNAHNVLLYFPPQSAKTSTIVLVYDPLLAAGSAMPAEKAQHLDVVEKELKKLAGVGVRGSAVISSVLSGSESASASSNGHHCHSYGTHSSVHESLCAQTPPSQHNSASRSFSSSYYQSGSLASSSHISTYDAATESLPQENQNLAVEDRIARQAKLQALKAQKQALQAGVQASLAEGQALRAEGQALRAQTQAAQAYITAAAIEKAHLLQLMEEGTKKKSAKRCKVHAGPRVVMGPPPPLPTSFSSHTLGAPVLPNFPGIPSIPGFPGIPSTSQARSTSSAATPLFASELGSSVYTGCPSSSLPLSSFYPSLVNPSSAYSIHPEAPGPSSHPEQSYGVNDPFL